MPSEFEQQRRMLARRTHEVYGKGGRGYIYVGEDLHCTAVFPTKREAIHAARNRWWELALLPNEDEHWADALMALLGGAGGDTMYADYGVAVRLR